MRYFKNCNTLEEVKTLYKKLAMENHPDKGGNTETMQSINTEYAFATAKILKDGNLNEEEIERELKFSEEYQQVLEKILHLEGIIVELVGLWIWVTGNTYPVRSALKDAGLFFASKKEAWYYRGEEFKGLRGGKKSLDEIKAKYGSDKIKTKSHFKLNN